MLGLNFGVENGCSITLSKNASFPYTDISVCLLLLGVNCSIIAPYLCTVSLPPGRTFFPSQGHQVNSSMRYAFFLSICLPSISLGWKHSIFWTSLLDHIQVWIYCLSCDLVNQLTHLLIIMPECASFKDLIKYHICRFWKKTRKDQYSCLCAACK